MLTPYLPYPLLSGGQIRTFNLLKHLSKNHQISLFALIKDQQEKQYITQLEKFCYQVKVFKRSRHPFTIKNILQTAISKYPFLVVRNYSTKAAAAVKEELKNNHYDLIHAETFYMMPHIKQTKIPTILVEQTIEYLGYENYADQASPYLRPLLNIDIHKIKNWEKHYWQRSNKLIVMSQEDKDFIKPFVRETSKIAVVENGVDIQWFDQKKRLEPEKPTILFVGTFNWLPNREAVKFLVNQVWPKISQQIKSARLWIVGNAPTEDVLKLNQRDRHIQVTGGIPDIRDAFRAATVLVAPVFSGKGTRYKVLEAMAAGTPVVATPLAVEGLKVKHQEHVLIAQTATDIAQATNLLIRNPKLRKKLAKNAKNFVAKHYDWPLIAQKLNKIYNNVA